MRTVAARELAALQVAGMALPTLEDSHGTGNSIINAPGKAMNGLSEHSVCPCQEVRKAYATQPSRNAA